LGEMKNLSGRGWCRMGRWILSAGGKSTRISHILELKYSENFAGRFLLCHRESAGLSLTPLNAIDYEVELER
jgi:hypothetical protein